MSIQSKIKKEIQNAEKQFNTDLSNLKVQFSNRLKKSNGNWRFLRNQNLHVINLSSLMFDKLGEDETIKTLRHELAHAVQFNLYGRTNHNEIFKKICVELGGSMNSRHAGLKYKDHVANFLPDKWKYTCPCGRVMTRTNRIRKKNQYCCTRCQRLISEMKEERNF